MLSYPRCYLGGRLLGDEVEASTPFLIVLVDVTVTVGQVATAVYLMTDCGRTALPDQPVKLPQARQGGYRVCLVEQAVS